MIFETHAHYDDDRFKDDRDETIKRVHEKGVALIINVGASIGSTMTTIELAKKYDFIYAAVGVHPSDVADLNEETFAWLREQTAWERTVAVRKSDWTITGIRSQRCRKTSATGLSVSLSLQQKHRCRLSYTRVMQHRTPWKS